MKPNKISCSRALVSAAIILILVSIAGAAPFAYITNMDSNNVSVIDTATNNVTATVDVGISPYGVAVSPDGSKVYVTNSVWGNGTVSVIDTATNTVTATVLVGDSPHGVAVTPDGKKVYVANYMGGTVSVIDTVSNTVISTVPVGDFDFPLGVAVTPDGTKAYVAKQFGNDISVIDTSTNTIISTVNVGTYPIGVAINPAGTKVYVTNSYNNVSVIDTTTNNVTGTVDVGYSPGGVAVTPDGTKVYVANSGNNTVSVIDTATNNVTATVNVGKWPFGVAVTPDGTKVYVANDGNNTVSVIDTATNTVTAMVPVGINPIAFGQFISSVPQLVLPVANFSANVTSGYTPLTVQFTDLSTNATGWNWNFGDGANSTLRNPTHTYSVAGNYTVNLMASNGNGTNSKLATITVLEKIASAENVQSVLPTVDGSIRDGLDPKDGIADYTMDNSVVQTLNVTQFEDRGIIEFDISKISGPITNATLNLSVFASNGPYPLKVGVFTYSGDGKLTLDDFNSGTLFHTFEYRGEKTIQLDVTTFLKSMVSSGAKYAAFNFRCLELSTIPMNGPFVAFNSLEYPPAAKLTIINSLLPVANFSSNVTSGYTPLTVQFTDLSINATGWNWNFGDGTNSTEQNPIHTYSSAGSYIVNLTASNANGTNSKLATITVLSVNPALTIVKSASPTNYSTVGQNITYAYDVTNSGNVNILGPVNVTDNKTGTIQISNSDLAPGQSVIGTANYTIAQADLDNGSVTNIAFATGTYNGTEINSANVTATVTAAMLPVAPVANFSSNVTSGYTPLTVQFTDLSTNATEWNWSFGDGTNSTQQNPVHAYSAVGNYTVNLTVSNANGMDSKLATINVLTPMQTIQQMTTFLQGSVTSGELNSGLGDVLIAAINAAKVSLNNGNTLATIIELKAFIAQVKIYINFGILSPTNGQTLIDEANAIINYLSNQVT